MPGKSRLLRSSAAVPDYRPKAINSSDFRTTFEAAKYLKTARQTLAKWRWMKIGPSYYRIGGRILYLKEDLDAFLARGRVDSPADAA